MQHNDFEKVKESLGGISRRDFIKFCSVVAAGMSLPLSAGKDIANAVTNPNRPPVIWLSGQGCTGCTESLLRPSTHFTLESLLLNLISLEYNETLNAGAGHQAENHKKKMVDKYTGKFVLVVEGAVPTKDGGIYCQIAGRPFQEILKETAEKAGAIIAIGSCASWGGLVKSDPNPTGAKGAPEVLKGKTVVTVPGCPPNPYNFLSTVAHYITYNKLPAIDQKGRPKFAYRRLIHEDCPRRPHFDAGRFAESFGDEGHQKGYCLYKLGCKGPVTYNNCSLKHFNDVGFDIPKFREADLTKESIITPSATPAGIHYDQGSGFSAGAAALAGAAVGAAAGAGAVTVKHMKSNPNEDDE